MYIALIDDDAGVLDALRYYLARQSMRTSTFKAAREFLEMLDRREQFELHCLRRADAGHERTRQTKSEAAELDEL